MLNKGTVLPVSRWNYKEDQTQQHLGPMRRVFTPRLVSGWMISPSRRWMKAAWRWRRSKGSTKNGKRRQKAEAQIEELRTENAELKTQLAELEIPVQKLAGE